jgi:hypothetical protein
MMSGILSNPSISEAYADDAKKLSEYISKDLPIFISAYPDKMSTHAGIFLASSLSLTRKKCFLKITYDKELSEEGLNILIGYNGMQNSSNEKVIVIPKIKSIQLKPSIDVIQFNPVYSILQILEGSMLIDQDKKVAVYSSIYQELKTPFETEHLISSYLSFTQLKILKKSLNLIGGSEKSLIDSLFFTIDPFYPSFSVADPGFIKQILEKEGIDPYLNYTQQSSEKVKRIAELLLNEYKKIDPNAGGKDLIRVSISATLNNIDFDLKEIAESIDIALEVSPASLYLFYAGMLPLHGLMVHRNFYIKIIADVFKKFLKKEDMTFEGNFLKIKCNEVMPVSFIGDFFRNRRLVDSKKIVVCERDGKLYTSIFELSNLDNETRNKILKSSNKLTFPYIEIIR